MQLGNTRTRWIRRLAEAGRRAWPYLLLALLCAMFYWEALWLPEGRTIVGEDATDMHAHWLRFALDSLRQGEMPLWNPLLFAGQPLAANPQAALFYPPTWLALLMPVVKALNLIAVLHVWLAGVGTYLWLKAEGASVSGALLGGLVFSFSGYFSVRVHSGHIGVVTTGAWLPLALWVYGRAVTRRTWQLAIVAGAPIAFSFLAGHTATFNYVILGLMAYAIFRAWSAWRQERRAASMVLPLVWLGLALVAGLAAAAVQLVPMVEYVLRTSRQAAPSYAFAARFSWTPGYLLTLLAPNFFGEPTHTGFWGDGIYHEFIYYIGILPLLLALLGLKRPYGSKPFLFALGLGALLLAFGQYGALHPLVYRFIPLARVMRAPARAAFLFTLAAAALAGLTLTELQSLTKPHRKQLLQALKTGPVLFVAGTALLLIVGGFGAFAWGRESNPAAGRLWHQANQITVFIFFFLLSAGLLAAWRNMPDQQAQSRARLTILTLGLALLDLWTFGSGTVEVMDVPQRTAWRAVAQAVPDPQATRVLPWGLNDVEQSAGMEYGLRSVFGYDPLVLQRYQTFIESWPDPRARTYDLLNAGYLMTLAPQTFPEGSDAPRLVYEQEGVWLYERPNALPRAWLVSQIEVIDDARALTRLHEADFDPRTTALVDSALRCAGLSEGTGELTGQQIGQVEIVRDQTNRIEARVRGAGGLLILSEVDYPGWRATLDGQPTPVLRADYVLRAVCAPPGEHQIVLIYDSPLLKWGLLITALAGLLILGAAIQLFLRGRRAEKV